MAATSYAEFDKNAVETAIATANEHNATFAVADGDTEMSLAGGGEFFVQAQCIGVVVRNHRICLRLPLGIGNVCLPIPTPFPDGTAAQACLGICTTWGFPTGLRVSVIIAGHTIVRKTFGRC